jgi:hypothetical protein
MISLRIVSLLFSILFFIPAKMNTPSKEKPIVAASVCGPGYVSIPSKPASVPTGFMLEKGKTYYYRTSGQWQDSRRLDPCDGNGFRLVYLAPFFFMKSYKCAPWFCLIGEVNGKRFRMGASGSFVASESGELCCFANDAKKHRETNYGNICLKVQENPFTGETP